MATLGTSSSHPDVIAELHDAGTDIFRLDFGHGSPRAHGERYRAIRDLDTGASRPAAILADLQGASFRLGLVIGGFVNLHAGESLRLDLDAAPGNRRRIPLPQPEFFAQMRPGDEIFIDGGGVRLLVMSAGFDHVETIVLAGGYVSDARRVTMPSCDWPGALTEKDRIDAVYAAALGVDWLALPAVCGAVGFAEIRSLVGARPRLMARLDNSSALATINETLAMADGILFARHDLAMSQPWAELCRMQKKLFMHCSATGKMLVAATQALTECGDATHDPSAILEDAAAALHCGAHVLTLCSSSAAGAFPVENVAMIERFIRAAECGICPEHVHCAMQAQEETRLEDVLHAAPKFALPGIAERLPCMAMKKRSGDLYIQHDSQVPAPR